MMPYPIWVPILYRFSNIILQLKLFMKLFLLRNFLIIICLGLGKQAVYAQISGRVINDKQQAIPNATILLDGTKVGTSTDSLGYFELDTKGQSTHGQAHGQAT